MNYKYLKENTPVRRTCRLCSCDILYAWKLCDICSLQKTNNMKTTRTSYRVSQGERKCFVCKSAIIPSNKKRCSFCIEEIEKKTVEKYKNEILKNKPQKVNYTLLAPFMGSFEDDFYWKEMYEVIALGENDQEIGRMQFTSKNMAMECQLQLTALYNAKIISYCDKFL